LLSIVTLLRCFSLTEANTENSIGNEGALKLSEALKLNTTLTSLGLRGNKCWVVSFSLNTGNDIDDTLQQQVEKSINQTREMWEEIHECIRTNDMKQLTTLLSKHTINLNSFNLSTDGDTILHSAAKSNDVKMMEFVLKRISPSTRTRMIKMKNKQQQLPADLVTRWTPSTHSLFPLKFRHVVKAVLMLGAKRQDGTPYYPQTHFYKLPKDLVFLILQYVVV
jgi:hypothetical protein